MYTPIDDVESGYYTGPKDRWAPGGLPDYGQFAEATLRQGFVRKVFGILALQLAITVGCIAAFLYSPPVKLYVASNLSVLWAALIVSFVLVVVLSCSEKARRAHPTNIIMLLAFTACEGVLLGAASATYDTNIVLLAVAITSGVVASLALFAMQTRIDFTASGGALLSLLTALLLASIIQAFVHASWLSFAISVGGAALFSVYLVFDIQLLMGGSTAAAFSPDEYVAAALALYLDILNLFLYILRILNDLSRNS